MLKPLDACCTGAYLEMGCCMVVCSTPFHSSYTSAEACNMTVDLAVQKLTALQVAMSVVDAAGHHSAVDMPKSYLDENVWTTSKRDQAQYVFLYLHI